MTKIQTVNGFALIDSDDIVSIESMPPVKTSAAGQAGTPVCRVSLANGHHLLAVGELDQVVAALAEPVREPSGPAAA